MKIFTPRLRLLLVLLSAGGTQRPAAADPVAASPPPVKMEKFVVNEKHLLCFGIGIELWQDKNTRQVLAMYVKAVQPDSMAELEGVVPGTRIWGINGVSADNFEATFAEGTELNKLFLNRQNGDQVTLEISQVGKRGTTFITLVQHSGMSVNISRNHPKAP